MMEQAWLDSLSEDWVSQPRSSGSPAPSLPSLSNSTSESSKPRPASSRIPKYNPQKKAWTSAHDGENSPLSERSTNEHNIPLSQRGPSKLREITNGSRGRRISRTLSASTTQSVQYHTIEHKSVSLSPKRGIHETPEWKRRLLHGDVAYGEQRDLFSPAGLENIFRPPPTQIAGSNKVPQVGEFDEDSVMPSSPPPYSRNREISQDSGADEEQHDGVRNRQQPRAMNYRLADEGGSDFSVDDLSRGSSFRPVPTPDRPAQITGVRIGSTSEQESSIVHVQDAGRTVSGQSDIRNEKLSPIYIARHNTVDGKIDYAALNLPPAELKRRLDIIRESTPGQSSQYQNESSEVLPVDITTETDDFAHNGRFVNLKRGGQSQEGSFQKRMLSPSSLPAIDESTMLPEESMQASTPKELPNIRKTRASNEYQKAVLAPVSTAEVHTPHQSPKKSTEKSSKSSSGSPLKIFGTYDTFTNQKLLRRLSQFEGDLDQHSTEASGAMQDFTRPELNDAFVAASSPQRPAEASRIQRGQGRKMNSFGAGELDSFEFSEGSYNTIGSNAGDEDKENMALPVLNPNTQSSFKFQLEPSPELSDDVVIHHRAKYTTRTSTTRKITSIRKSTRPGTGSSVTSVDAFSPQAENLKTPRKRNGDSEGKRLPKTPLKDPTPKRRRTLNNSETNLAERRESTGELDPLRDTHNQMQSVVGRKRKDARHGDDQQAANPKVLAMRQILRPRTPTPSQRSSQQHESAPVLEETLTSSQRTKRQQEQKLAKIQAELDSTGPFRMSAALGVGQHMLDESRKGSVTTQDFLDEAKKIMAGIRGKTRPRSGLTSLEESESENDRGVPAEGGILDVEDSFQESTQEPFSRPPSRDGKPLLRLPLKQEDPALLDHLRKYQETSDINGVIASSMRSIAMAKEAADVAKEIDRRTDEAIARSSSRSMIPADTVESEPPNIRISQNPDAQRKRKHSTSSVRTGEDHEADFLSQGSNGSSGQSTARSIPTGSSRGSDSRRVIAPHTVSHLIPEQLAGMVFDHESKKWVKTRTAGSDNGARNFLPSDETDEDPFGDIPDLSVDETQELQRIKAVAAKRKEDERLFQEQRDNTSTQSSLPATAMSNIGPQAYADHKLLQEQSGVAQLSSEQHTPSTESESQSHKSASPPKRQPDIPEKSIHAETKKIVADEVEREISIHEDRVDSQSPQRRRNVTISFSSPLASIIQASTYDADSSMDRDPSDTSQLQMDADEDGGNDSIIVLKKANTSSQRSSSTKTRSTFRSTSRRMSLRGHKFPARPVSRIDEQDEDSTSENLTHQQRRSVSVIVSTPVPSRHVSDIILATPRPSHEVGTLTLTPLSDFTVHQADVSLGLDVSYVAQGHRYTVGSASKKALSLSIKDLVEKLTEVEPYEPFWENIKELSLRDKRLTNLHKLNEFCEELVQLDVSHNHIRQLDGVPTTTRSLRVSHNCLNDLAAWNHLHNLQYIDVSNNELETMSAFRSLIHLRGIRADNNKIKSLDGVNQLDGLLSLRLRGNAITSIDFQNTMLLRLSDLDVRNNNITDVRNLQELRSLSALDLEDNRLSDFSMNDVVGGLRYLKLSGNNLENIDVSMLPNLRLLYLDRNRLGMVSGLLKTKYLDSLSIREQQNGTVIDKSFLSDACEVRKLFLSGNFLGTFEPQVDFLNLQYLELANCGIESLPDDFGHTFPNTRVLNLNFNALRDIKPLVGIARLKKLHLAGNRLARLRSAVCVLAQFPTLALADLRGNPLTLGFYPAVTENRMISRQDMDEDETSAQDPFTLGTADRGQDDKYVACLDMDTRMLRRVYEVMILTNCRRVKTLDGLEITKFLLQSKDKVWEALVQAGVFEPRPGEAGTEQGSEEENAGFEPEPEKPVEERWPGEDSFA
ncbi:leucine rich repeat [Cadophora gregata]|uniref:leucine rich repeat n=1 Tax=Cadophora gregata TaxID=51156 RepID=UPI0026DC85ED|nr:leucine rich repeat [Cadophora gregata]KAK0103451.1 leucine rich repeat [Cadophora gregata]